MKALQVADVVLYDALANETLLDYAPAHALKIFVGKRAQHHIYSQAEINTLCVRYALSHGHVVRLKGGDPFVFGRGQEEIQAAQAHQIPTEIISGVSSAIAAPAAAGIPVTLRGISDSFWVLTGAKAHESDSPTRIAGVSNDFKTAAQTDATIIVLMGLGQLAAILEIFRAADKQDYPIAIVQNATLAGQKIAVGTIANIEAEVAKQGIKAPAVIIIGKVVAAASGIKSRQNTEGVKPCDTATAQHAQPQSPEITKTEKVEQATEPRHLRTDVSATNPLFPIFLKLNQLRLLIVGGGYVATEKITAVLENSPETQISLVAPEIRPEIQVFAAQYPNVKLIDRPYEPQDLENKDLILVATNDKALNRQIKAQATAKGLLTNVADTPEECDFYLGSIVKKGSLKIAISTNGKSPTMSKRIREVLTDVFPDELEHVFENLRVIRASLKGDFEEKVKKLNELTSLMTR